jgi:hypothetical protein
MPISRGYFVGTVAGSAVAALLVLTLISPTYLSRNPWAVQLILTAGGIIGVVLARLLAWKQG